MRKYLILQHFYDVKTAKSYNKDEIVELRDGTNLIEKGLAKEIDVEDKNETILELYNKDKNVIDDLSVAELKSLCKVLGIKFTKEDEIREQLKAE